MAESGWLALGLIVIFVVRDKVYENRSGHLSCYCDLYRDGPSEIPSNGRPEVLGPATIGKNGNFWMTENAGRVRICDGRECMAKQHSM